MLRPCFLLLFALLLVPAAGRAEQLIQLCPLAESDSPPAQFHNVRMMRAGSNGWLFALRDFHKAPELDDDTQTQLTRFAQQLAVSGTRLVIALVPQRILSTHAHLTPGIKALMPHDVSAIRNSYFDTQTALSSTGALVPDLLTALETHDVARDGSLFFMRDHHWTPIGARVVASALAQTLITLPETTAIPQISFASTVIEQRRNNGSYAKFATAACGIHIEPEPYDFYQTIRTGAGSLLDDAAPGISLAGTSFSLDAYNFSGFLSETLGREVQNVSVDGGGIDNALATYLASDSFILTRPPILIWEVPALYKFDVPSMWRQIIPAASGACSDSTALATASITLAGETKLLGNINLKVTPGVDFLYLESNDAGLVDFSIRFEYADGRRETIQISRSTRAENSGRFFLELNRNYSANLRAVTLTPDSPSRGTIMARICPGAS